MLKEILISITESSIQAIRVAANSEDIYLISSELEHLIKILGLLKNKYGIRDYLEVTQNKYIEKICENPYEYLWSELEKNKSVIDDYKFILNELEDIIIDIILIGVDNIGSYMDNKDYRNIYIEAYHIHNLPSIITSNEKKELIKYYQEIEKRQYLKECQKNAKKKFKNTWKKLDKITKVKKKSIIREK